MVDASIKAIANPKTGVATARLVGSHCPNTGKTMQPSPHRIKQMAAAKIKAYATEKRWCRKSAWVPNGQCYSLLHS